MVTRPITKEDARRALANELRKAPRIRITPGQATAIRTGTATKRRPRRRWWRRG